MLVMRMRRGVLAGVLVCGSHRCKSVYLYSTVHVLLMVDCLVMIIASSKMYFYADGDGTR